MKRIGYTLLFTLLTASLLLSACSSATTAAPTNTQAQATPTAEVVAPTSPPTNTPAPTNTEAPTATQAPTNTPLPTEAATATQAALPTSTPATPGATATTAPSGGTVATALVNENTNCRGGPTTDYPVIVVIMSGQTAKVVSKTTLDDYVLVENPLNPPETCWLWTQYATINGNLASLPVATPPPPLVNYTLEFTLVKYCEGYALEFKVLNTGVKTLQAYKVIAKDITSHTQQTSSETVFDLMQECYIERAIGFIDPGKVGYMYARDFSYDPTGHSMEATVTICSHNDMTGVCATQVYKFTP